MSILNNYLDNYSFKTKLPGTNEEINYKPITFGQIKQIAMINESDDLNVYEDALDKLLIKCIDKKDFDISNMFINDRIYLLIEIRKSSKGSIYEFEQKCKNCNSQYMTNINLNKLKVTKLKETNELITLDNKLQIKLQHQKRKDQKDAALYINNIKNSLINKSKKNKNDIEVNNALNNIDKIISVEMPGYIMARCIEKVYEPNGNEIDIKFEDKQQIVDNFTENDFKKIEKWFDDNKFGLDLTIKYNCPHCNNEELIEVPIDSFFTL